MCLAQGPQCSDAGETLTAAPQSRVKHSTTEPLRSLNTPIFGGTVKPVVSGSLKKKRQSKGLKDKSSLMKVESIAECSKRAFCNTFDLHQAIIGLQKQFLVFCWSGRLRLVLL